MSLRKNILCDMEFVVGGDSIDLRKSSAIKIKSYPPEIQKVIANIKPEKGKYYYVLHAVGSYEHWGPTVDGNAFELEELIKGVDYYKKLGKAYLNHWMDKGPIGNVLEAVFDDVGKRILLLVEIDEDMLSKNTAGTATKNIMLEKLRSGERIPVSNGVDPDMDVCSICGNVRRSYKDPTCVHIRDMVGHILEDGRIVAMLNKGLKFDDISFLTLSPADRSAYTLKKVANEGGVIEDTVVEPPTAEDRFEKSKAAAIVKINTVEKACRQALRLHLEYLLDLGAYFGKPTEFCSFLVDDLPTGVPRAHAEGPRVTYYDKIIPGVALGILLKLKLLANLGKYFKFKFVPDMSGVYKNKLEAKPEAVRELLRGLSDEEAKIVQAFIRTLTEDLSYTALNKFVDLDIDIFYVNSLETTKNYEFNLQKEVAKIMQHLGPLMDSVHDIIYVPDFNIYEENPLDRSIVLVTELPEAYVEKLKRMSESSSNNSNTSYTDYKNRILFLEKLKILYNKLK